MTESDNLKADTVEQHHHHHGTTVPEGTPNDAHTQASETATETVEETHHLSEHHEVAKGAQQ